MPWDKPTDGEDEYFFKMDHEKIEKLRRMTRGSGSLWDFRELRT